MATHISCEALVSKWHLSTSIVTSGAVDCDWSLAVSMLNEKNMIWQACDQYTYWIVACLFIALKSGPGWLKGFAWCCFQMPITAVANKGDRHVERRVERNGMPCV